MFTCFFLSSEGSKKNGAPSVKVNWTYVRKHCSLNWFNLSRRNRGAHSCFSCCKITFALQHPQYSVFGNFVCPRPRPLINNSYFLVDTILPFLTIHAIDRYLP